MTELTWVEIDKEALKSNILALRGLVGAEVKICACVKANAYGHGLTGVAKIFLEAGADFLGVNALYEARDLRKAGIDAPVYVMGYIPSEDFEEALILDLRFVFYNEKDLEKLEAAAKKTGKKARIHLKAETGNNRQGILKENLVEFAKKCLSFENVEIEGLATHFANIEDTTDHSYAEKQLAIFEEMTRALQKEGINIPIRHCGNSAATILFPKTHFEMVRPGIACFGMWPSKETFVSYVKDFGNNFKLTPAFTWKSQLAQIKEIAENEFVGYGCTYKTTRKTKLGIVPVGYYDGYVRELSNKAYVLIQGKRAPLRGRVCMNIIMVDVTDIPEAKLNDEVVLMGKMGEEEISAEQFAAWAGSINYEVVTRVNERIPRRYV